MQHHTKKCEVESYILVSVFIIVDRHRNITVISGKKKVKYLMKY